MKIHLILEEMNRIYIVDGKEGYYWIPEVDVPEELIVRFKKAEKEFRAADEEMYQLYLAARNKSKESGGK